MEHLAGCRVDRLPLRLKDGYAVSAQKLGQVLALGYDLVAPVNPNSPTGQVVSRTDLEPLLEAASSRTRFWIDETYTDYAGPDQPLERFAAASRNVLVCKSMSKAYALSGARVAYLAGTPQLLAELRRLAPPWAVSLLGQVAAVRALEDPDYYAARWQEPAALREALAPGLGSAAQHRQLRAVPPPRNRTHCRRSGAALPPPGTLPA